MKIPTDYAQVIPTPGPISVDIGKSGYTKGRWTEMLQEYYNAHLELDEELSKIKRESDKVNSLFNWHRIFWIFKRKTSKNQSGG